MSGGSLDLSKVLKGPGTVIRSAYGGGVAAIGDTLADMPVVVVGAQSVLAYSPAQGYYETTQLQPGQGAFARTDSAVLVTPNTNQAVFDCSQSDAAKAYDALSPIWLQFADNTKLAQNTPRFALASVISQMQATRRSWGLITAPQCAEPAHFIGGIYMDQRIKESLDFLGIASDFTLHSDADTADFSESLVANDFVILQFIGLRY